MTCRLKMNFTISPFFEPNELSPRLNWLQGNVNRSFLKEKWDIVKEKRNSKNLTCEVKGLEQKVTKDITISTSKDGNESSIESNPKQKSTNSTINLTENWKNISIDEVFKNSSSYNESNYATLSEDKYPQPELQLKHDSNLDLPSNNTSNQSDAELFCRFFNRGEAPKAFIPLCKSYRFIVKLFTESIMEPIKFHEARNNIGQFFVFASIGSAIYRIILSLCWQWIDDCLFPVVDNLRERNENLEEGDDETVDMTGKGQENKMEVERGCEEKDTICHCLDSCYPLALHFKPCTSKYCFCMHDHHFFLFEETEEGESGDGKGERQAAGELGRIAIEEVGDMNW